MLRIQKRGDGEAARLLRLLRTFASRGFTSRTKVNDLLGGSWHSGEWNGHVCWGADGLGSAFDALGKAEQGAVIAYVRNEYDALVFQQPASYVSRNAQSDPEGWQDSLRELIASDPKRVQAITETAERIKRQGGFTLIELSIVLVIIGLIVGGVLECPA